MALIMIIIYFFYLVSYSQHSIFIYFLFLNYIFYLYLYFFRLYMRLCILDECDVCNISYLFSCYQVNKPSSRESTRQFIGTCKITFQVSCISFWLFALQLFIFLLIFLQVLLTFQSEVMLSSFLLFSLPIFYLYFCIQISIGNAETNAQPSVHTPF